MDWEICQHRGSLVPVDALLAGRPDGNRDQRADHVRFGLLATGEQESPEAASDRGQDDIVHGAAKLDLL